MIRFAALSIRRLGALVLFGLAAIAGEPAAPGPAAGDAAPRPVKHVFLFIGDGLSLPQREMAEEYARRTGSPPLAMNAMPVLGLARTGSADSVVTDSAAAATALACGVKTHNGRIGLDADGERAESVAAVARDAGRRVGIVTSVTLNHATPAGFYAHNPSRNNYYAIALDLLASGFHYFGGGGIDRHNDEKNPGYRGDIYALAAEAGFAVSRRADGFAALRRDGGADRALSVGAGGSLPYAVDRREAAPTLADFTRQAIEWLDGPAGFFLMVEGGRIDGAGHDNDAATAVREILDFDAAVRVGLDFLARHPDDTLVVVTGDHETGGLTLGNRSAGHRIPLALLAGQTRSRHEMVRAFRRWGDRTDAPTFDGIRPLIAESSGLVFHDGGGERPTGGAHLTEKEEEELAEAYAKQLRDGRFVEGHALADAAVGLLNRKAGVGWTTGGHTALPAPTTAAGREAHRFAGLYENTRIAELLKEFVR